MKILALDLGTTTGWALGWPLGSVQSVDSGSWSFKTKKTDGPGAKFLNFKRWLSEFDPIEIDHVYYEKVMSHSSVYAAHAYGGFLAILMVWCEIREIPYTGIGVGSIKKSWTGKGNAKKWEMIDEAKRRGFDPLDDNEADALALLDYVINKDKK